MDPCARLAWRDLRRLLERIVHDLDAVIRAHVGGPVLGFEALPTTNGEPEIRLSCGATRLRLSARPLAEAEGVLSSAADPVLVVSLRAEHEPEAAVVIRVDAVNRRWVVPEEPHDEHRLDDRAALETVLFSVLADARDRVRRSPRERAAARTRGAR